MKSSVLLLLHSKRNYHQFNDIPTSSSTNIVEHLNEMYKSHMSDVFMVSTKKSNGTITLYIYLFLMCIKIVDVLPRLVIDACIKNINTFRDNHL
jgi:WD40 repeat protein